MKKIKQILLFIATFSMMVSAQEPGISVAERNAAQGLNDTIDRLAPDFVIVSLCIADPTDQSQDYLGMTGHAFLRLQCPTFGLDYCCSYESERIKGQVWDYLTGKLKMGMFSVNTDEYLEDYRIWQRAVHEYRMNIPSDAKLRLWEQMDGHVSLERELQMDLIKFGCANTVLRYVEKALSPTQIEYNWPEKFYTLSAMEIAHEHMRNYPWSYLVMYVIAYGEFSQLESPKQKIIFPTDLLEVWSQSTIEGEPLLTYIGDIVKADPVLIKKPWFTPCLCGILFLLLMVGVIYLRYAHKRKK